MSAEPVSEGVVFAPLPGTARAVSQSLFKGASTGKGTLVGRAADSGGALLPGARVRVDPGNVSVVTNQVGEFTVIDLAPGD